MRIDFIYPVHIYNKQENLIKAKRSLRSLHGIQDQSEDADLTLDMEDESLARLGLQGIPLTLFWDNKTSTLHSRISFHTRDALSDANLKELTEYIHGQVLDGYGEDRIILKKRWFFLREIFFAEFIVNEEVLPEIVDDGVELAPLSNGHHLLWAVRDHDSDTFYKFMSQGTDQNSLGKIKLGDILDAAVKSANCVFVSDLLKAGANPNYLEPMVKFGPLSSAAMNGDVTTMTLLLNAGGKINLRTYQQMTPLMWAANRNKPDMVKFLISQKAGLNKRSSSRRTALDYSKSQDISDLLIQAGAKSGSASLSRANHGTSRGNRSRG